MYERIIVTDDGSELARTAIPRTATIAVACGSEVLVLRISHAEGGDASDLDDEDWRAHVGGPAAAGDRAEPREAEPRLSTFVDALSASGVRRAGSLLLKGSDAAASIATAARALDAGLLVMTTHGLGGLQRAVLGRSSRRRSTADRGGSPCRCRATITFDGSTPTSHTGRTSWSPATNRGAWSTSSRSSAGAGSCTGRRTSARTAWRSRARRTGRARG